MREYPIDLKLSNDGPIVNFISQNEGTVIIGDEHYHTGFHSTEWINSQDTIMWHELDKESTDYVIEEIHESKMSLMKSNYSYSVKAIFDCKETAERELQSNSKYKWSGNQTGSVSYNVRERKETDKVI